MLAMYRHCSPAAVAGASEDEFLWAILLVLSRAYSLTLPAKIREGQEGGGGKAGGQGHEVAEKAGVGKDGGEEEEAPYAFVPFADFLNHAVNFNLMSKVRCTACSAWTTHREVEGMVGKGGGRGGGY